MNKKDNIQKSEIERDSSGRYLIKSSSKANPETEEIHNSKSQKTIVQSVQITKKTLKLSSEILVVDFLSNHQS